jgi:hypothetical protein
MPQTEVAVYDHLCFVMQKISRSSGRGTVTIAADVLRIPQNFIGDGLIE